MHVEKHVYKKTPQGGLEMHIHFPEGWSAEDRRGGIVFFHGGAWARGSRGQFETQAEYLSGRGMVAARVEYRLREKHGTTPDKCVEDAKSAMRWVRKNAAKLGIDPDRIVAGGGSAGGHMSACCFTTEGLDAEGEDLSVSVKPNLLILFNPVLNCTGERIKERVGSEKLAGQISPNLHLTKDVPPAILFYGTEDRMLEHGREFVARSKELGNTAELYTAEGVGHAFFNNSPWRERTLYLADQFLAEYGYLKGEPTFQPPEGIGMNRADASPE